MFWVPGEYVQGDKLFFEPKLFELLNNVPWSHAAKLQLQPVASTELETLDLLFVQERGRPARL